MSDAIAYLAWPALGMKGWMEYYSGYSPQWRIAHATDQWVLGMQQAGAIPVNRQLFFRPFCFCEMPIPTLKEAFAMVAPAAPYVLDRDNQGLVLETAKAFPCEEDFDLEKSHNRRLKNFRRTITPSGGRSMWYDPLKTGILLRKYSLNGLTIPLKTAKI